MQEKCDLTLAQVLQILKEKKEVSLNQIQLETGLSKSYLSRLTNGSRDNPSLLVLSKLAEFFDTDVSTLLKNILIIDEENIEGFKQERQQVFNITKNKELDNICKEIWEEIQNYCSKETTTRNDEISILNKIDKLKILNKNIS